MENKTVFVISQQVGDDKNIIYGCFTTKEEAEKFREYIYSSDINHECELWGSTWDINITEVKVYEKYNETICRDQCKEEF